MANKYKDKEIEEILNSIVILIDSREKKNNHIKTYLISKKINFEIKKLDFGDYSFMIPKNVDLNINQDVYFEDEIVIERKANAEEISGNLSQNRARFKKEFERGNNKIRLLIENSSYAKIYNGEYNTKLNPSSFLGSLHSMQEKYNAPFFFIDKEYSGQYIYNTFKYYLRNKLKNNLDIMI